MLHRLIVVTNLAEMTLSVWQINFFNLYFE